jgi:RNA polymerase sigma-70 factor (ECF subfamily)
VVRHSGSEAELVAQLRGGDEAAFTEIVERYHAQLIHLASTFVRTAEAAEDAAQETWIALIKGIERFEERSSLRTWLFQVCVNRARTIGAREHRSVPVEEIGPAVDAASFTTSGAWTSPPRPWPEEREDVLCDAATVEQIREAIRDLPELQRAVVTMRDIDGLPAPDVCRILSITASNQRVLLHRGREQIRRDISRVVLR